MVKIDVISGFLGAGKTTLIKKLFESAFKTEKVVIIENEFGEIGIDGSFLKDSGIEIKEINAGCICCSLVGDFSASIKEVIDRYNPDRIIIEPSGVGKLSDIISAIQKVGIDTLKLNILATVVDGPKAKIYLKNFGEFFINQVEAANTVVISKLDKMSEDKIEAVVAMIKEKNDHANIVTTPISAFSSEALLHLLEEQSSLQQSLLEKTLNEVQSHHDEECHCHDHDHHHHHDEEECHCHDHHHDEDEDEECHCHDHEHEHDEECHCHDHDHEHHHHHDEEECHCHEHHDHDEECHCHDHEHHHHHGHDADEVFTSWGKETAKSISIAELESFLSHLANDEDLGIIVRSKGILKASDNEKWYYFDFVSGDYEIRLGDPDYTGRIVVIGSKLNKEKINSLFFGK